jgi:large subunit ribosomal protein L21
MYAIVKVGGKQYRVEEGDSLVVDRLSAGEGDKVDLQPLLLAGEGDPVFGGEELGKVKVEATVTRHERGKKIHGLKFKPKHGSKRRYGHRSDLTRLEIAAITAGGKRAARTADAGPAASREAKPKEPAKQTGTTKESGAASKTGESAPKPSEPAKQAGTSRSGAASKEDQSGS